MAVSSSLIKGLKCRECGRAFPAQAIYVCDYCFGSLEVDYDYDRIKGQVSRETIAARAHSIWRYREFLPIDGEPTVGFDTGMTPLLRARNLGEALGLKELYVKDDSVCHPTLSFKDRVVSVALSRAKELGFDTASCASTGNLANAVSALSARAGMKRVIFIPADLEMGKVVNSLVFAPTLVAVEGNYDEVNRLCAEIGARHKWAFVNINIRPYYAEGSKTYGFEVAEQLGWRAPKHIVVPAASGSLLVKIWKGFKEFHAMGLIPKPETRMYAAQAAGCGPIVEAVEQGSDIIKPVKPKTIAKSLAIGNPADGYYAADAIRETGGWGAAVTDDEIVEGIKLLAATEGVFTETAGGVTVAAARKLAAAGRLPKNESVVICITGQGLKTQEAVMHRIGKPIKIKPTLKAFEEAMERSAS
ncbi:MAG: threonine synthase [Candidatus Omnitrophica bacterium CG11_big_fil_rev_8_21_14_0_20_64_10]|nr:MAG: threonine synthase [Candidatus Omnitrophica bacterium CG11_big_fil_rev_8_21_14_0_20_64_10]